MLYARALGEAFGTLPEALQAFHSVTDTVLYVGRVEVSHGGPLARAVAAAGGLPRKAGDMPFAFRATRDGDAEIWERDFDGHVTRSRQWLAAPGMIAEQVGPGLVHMVPEVRGASLHIPFTGAKVFGLRMPRGALQTCGGVISVTQDGHIGFDVQARVPGLGLIIRYRGRMAAA